MNIHELIPHRPPFLLVDDVVAVEGQAIQTRYAIPLDFEICRGHFPGFALMPGVLIVEAILQSGAILMSHLVPGGIGENVPAVTRLNNAKFKQMVRPGETLEMAVELVERLSNAFFMKGAARVNGKLACSLEFAFTAIAKPQPAQEGAPA